MYCIESAWQAVVIQVNFVSVGEMFHRKTTLYETVYENIRNISYTVCVLVLLLITILNNFKYLSSICTNLFNIIANNFLNENIFK